MRKVPAVTYLTPEELDEISREREAEAATLPPGASRQSILKEAAQLRAYADAKRLLAPSRLKKQG